MDSNSSGEIKQSGGISSSAILISPMDFVHVISEVPVWKNAKATNKVFVNDPEKYFAYMTEIEPVNPRHLVDIIHKFQPLLSWTKNSVFAKVLLAFQYDNKYYVLYEFFEEENRKVALDEAKEFYKNAVEALYEIHKQGLFHGDICRENIRITKNGFKIIGWKLPAMRSFDPIIEPDWTVVDVLSLQESIAQITGFHKDQFFFNSVFENSLEKSEKINENSEILEFNENYDDQDIFFVSGKYLKAFNCENEKTKIINELKIPKGSSLNYFNSFIVNLGGDGNDFLFRNYNLITKTWAFMPSLLTPHKYHTAITYNQELWVLGGINSNKCEKFDGLNWETGPSLLENHENPTCSIHNTLFIISKGIEKLESNEWTKILCIDWIGCLGIVLNSNEILLIGGRSYSSYNSEVFLSNLSTTEIKKLKDGNSGMFGLYDYKIKNNKIYVPNNAGKIVIEDLL